MVVLVVLTKSSSSTGIIREKRIPVDSSEPNPTSSVRISSESDQIHAPILDWSDMPYLIVEAHFRASTGRLERREMRSSNVRIRKVLGMMVEKFRLKVEYWTICA